MGLSCWLSACWWGVYDRKEVSEPWDSFIVCDRYVRVRVRIRVKVRG